MQATELETLEIIITFWEPGPSLISQKKSREFFFLTST